jgi:hypothetical protein
MWDRFLESVPESISVDPRYINASDMQFDNIAVRNQMLVSDLLPIESGLAPVSGQRQRLTTSTAHSTKTIAMSQAVTRFSPSQEANGIAIVQPA